MTRIVAAFMIAAVTGIVAMAFHVALEPRMDLHAAHLRAVCEFVGIACVAVVVWCPAVLATTAKETRDPHAAHRSRVAAHLMFASIVAASLVACTMVFARFAAAGHVLLGFVFAASPLGVYGATKFVEYRLQSRG